MNARPKFAFRYGNGICGDLVVPDKNKSTLLEVFNKYGFTHISIETLEYLRQICIDWEKEVI